MPDTIREQIITAFENHLPSWTTAKGFSINCGQSVHRANLDIGQAILPACVLIPGTEEVNSQYGLNVCTMSLRVEALATVGTTNPSVIQEQLLGDTIKIMTDPAPYLTLTFDALAPYTAAVATDVGKTVTGGTTGDTGTLISYDNTAKTWVIDPDTPADEFDNATEGITIASGTGAGTLSAAGIPERLTHLIEDITYKTGGPAATPKGEDTLIAVFAEFEVNYNTLSGNPYSQ